MLRDDVLNSILRQISAPLNLVRLSYCDLGKNLIHFCDIDVPASRAHHNVDRRDKNVSLPI